MISSADPDEPHRLSSRSLRIDVRNRMLAQALSATAAQQGWLEVTESSERAVLVTDQPPARPVGARGGNDVALVCDATPWHARYALNCLASLLIGSVICSDQPADLSRALDAMANGAVTVPGRVLELASAMPLLSERQSLVIRGLLAGHSNQDISHLLNVSLASVKRDLGTLYAAFDVSTRTGLAAAAIDAGVPPHMPTATRP